MDQDPGALGIAKLIGAHIRRVRVMRGVSQVELAKATALSPSRIEAIERGRSEAAGTFLIKAAHALDVRPGSLLDEAGGLGLDQ